MNIKQLLFSLSIVSILGACNSSEKSESTENKEAEKKEVKDKKPVSTISIEPLTPASPKFENADLSLENYEVQEDGKVAFEFNVENYELGAQTSDAEGKGLANSGKGQHIHFIPNNSPYAAHYDSEFFSNELGEGNHVVLAFLSRSYHESVKSDGAAVLTQIQVGEGGEEVDLDQELMFYSRPKGTYKGADAKNILLDFYLFNVDLAIDGHKVKATINGQEFLLTKWVPYVIKGAPMGELTIKLELIDAENNLVDAPYNPVERTVTLEE